MGRTITELDAGQPVPILGRKAPLRPGIQVKPYDFKRPDKFSKDQIRTVSIMHETFARLSTSSLSAMLRHTVHLHVSAVDQLTYGEFIRAIPNPSMLAVLNPEPLRGSVLLEIDPDIAFVCLDGLFGGRGKAIRLDRDLTDIEASVMEGVILRLMANLREAWSTVLDLKPRLGSIETNPLFAQIVPPSEMVIVVTFEVMVNQTTAGMNLCLPYLTIEPIIPKLSAQYWYSTVRLSKNFAARDISGLKAGAEVYFEGQPISLAEIHQLRKNSLVKLNDVTTAFLAAGNRTVCRFQAKQGRGALVFTAAEDGGPEEDAAELPVGEREGEDAIEKSIQAPLAKLTAEVKSALDAIAGKVGELTRRQEELEDQLFHNGAAKAAGPAALTGLEAGAKPFAFLGAYDREAFFKVIELEHPQTSAMILSFCDPGWAADFIARLPEEGQADIAERIALIKPSAPEVIDEVERVLKKKLLWADRKKQYKPETDTIINILNVTGRKVEKNIMDRLLASNPELAEQINRKLFVFEDTVLLDDRVIRLILERADPTDLVFALKAVNDKTKEHFLSNMTDENQGRFKSNYQEIGPVRLVDVDGAQQRIIALIRKMEEDGEIVVARSEDMIVE